MFLILKQTFPKTRATSGIMTYNHSIIDAIDQVPFLFWKNYLWENHWILGGHQEILKR